MRFGDGAIGKPGRLVLLALGSNEKSAWGDPAATLRGALMRLHQRGFATVAVSDVFLSAPLSAIRQATYCNAVACVTAPVGAARLLRVLKAIEREAGRRLGRHWGPRPLDLDIIDAGCVVGWRTLHALRGRRVRGGLVLPHPEMHRRAFVLQPLAQVAPHWRHPVLQRSVRQLLATGEVRRQVSGVRRADGISLRPCGTMGATATSRMPMV